ncbi:MAG: glycosyltransferase family 2 protein [Actinomycetota bacterium]
MEQSTSIAVDDPRGIDVAAAPDGISLLAELAQSADGLIVWDSEIPADTVTSASDEAARDMAVQAGAGPETARLARVHTSQLRSPADPDFDHATLIARDPWLRLRLDGWGEVDHRRLANGDVVLVKRLKRERTVLSRLRAAGYELDRLSCVVTDSVAVDSPHHLAAATPLVPSRDVRPAPRTEPDHPHPPGPVAPVVAVIPAHNEAATVRAALASLDAQTLAPMRTLVVSDNSTDPTPSLVAELDHAGIELIRTVNNDARKAGALNAGIRHLTATGALGDVAPFVLTMDADTELHPQFLELSLRILETDPAIGGLSATCLGRIPDRTRRWGRIVAWFQQAEYARYSYTRVRTNIHTMSGAAALYRTTALDDLLEDRGAVFDERPTNLVEDYETTLALRDRGWACTTNSQTIAYTQLETTLRDLVRQRQRWVRGTVDELRRRGRPDRHTWPSVVQIALGAVALPWVYAWITYALAVGLADGRIAPVWLAFTGAIALWQAWTIRPLGRRSMVAAGLLVPELLYGLVRSYWFFTAIGRSFTGRSQSWDRQTTDP